MEFHGGMKYYSRRKSERRSWVFGFPPPFQTVVEKVQICPTCVVRVLRVRTQTNFDEIQSEIGEMQPKIRPREKESAFMSVTADK